MYAFGYSNNTNPELAGGGSHWSLLVYAKSVNKFLHYDSAGPMNMSYARRTAKKVAKRIGIKGEARLTFNCMLNFVTERCRLRSDYEVVGMHTPQQENGKHVNTKHRQKFCIRLKLTIS